MIRMGKKSRLSPQEVVDKASEFFHGEWGLGVKEYDNCCARFEGGGGHVFVQASNLEGGSGSNVEVEGREWDHQIKQFIGKI